MHILSYIFFIYVLPRILAGALPFQQTYGSDSDLFFSAEEIFAPYEGTNLKCNYTLLFPKKVINPYKSDLQNHVPQKPFGSFYQKCAACLAVATEVKNIIDKTAKYNGTVYKHQSAINEEIAQNISDLCSKGFKDFDLRNYNDVSVVSNNFRCTKHVNTNMDGGWTKKLREMCSLYTSHMDLEHMSTYADNLDELVDNMCKEAGVFRDCLNVEDIYLPVVIEHMQELNRCSENCPCSSRARRHSEIYDIIE